MGYMPPKNMYDAKIGDKQIRVDIYDLPYDKFDSQTPLIIFGDVVLADQTRTTDLGDVQIMGSLDISKQKYSIVLPKIINGKFICRSNPQMRDIQTKRKKDIFDENFIFPDGITEIDCSHSINSLAVLNGRIPTSVKKIIVADAILANIGDSIEKFTNATIFQQHYPHIEVIGEKKGKTLQETLHTTQTPVQIPSELLENPLEANIDTTVRKPEYAFKPHDFMDESDIFELFQKDENVKSFKILDSTLKRKIRKLMEKFDTKTFKDKKSGTAVVCIKKSDASKLLALLKTELQQKAAQQARENAPVLKDTEYQTEDFYNINEIIQMCLDNKEVQSLGNIDDVLIKQKVRKHMKTCERKILINPQTKTQISCVPRSKGLELIEKIIAELKEIYRKKPHLFATLKESDTAKKQTQKAYLQTPKSVPLMPVAIKKYIPENLWKSICKACGKSDKAKRFVLETICSVNIDITTMPSLKHLQVIDPITYKVVPSSYMKQEGIQSIVQSIHTYLIKDNKRIVWTYLPEEKVLVCTGVFEEHTKTKAGNNYAKVRDFASVGLNANGEKITLAKIKSENYLDAFDLLVQYTNESIFQEQNLSEQISEQTSEKPVKRQRITVRKTEKTNYVPHQKHVNPEQKLLIIEPKGTTPMKETEKTNANAPQQPAQAELVPEHKTTTDQVDVFAIQTYLKSFIATIDKVVQQGFEAVSAQQDTEKQLAELDLTRAALVQKAKIESMLPEFTKTCELLSEIQQNAQKTLNR